MRMPKLVTRSGYSTKPLRETFRAWPWLIAAIWVLTMFGCSTMPSDQQIQRTLPADALRPCGPLSLAESGDPRELLRVHVANMEAFAECEQRRATLATWAGRCR